MTENTTPESTSIKPRLTTEERESLYLDYVNDLDMPVEGLLSAYGVSKRTLERLLKEKNIPTGMPREFAVFAHMLNSSDMTRTQLIDATQVALQNQSPKDIATTYMLNLSVHELGQLWANVIEIQNKAVLSGYLEQINQDILNINTKLEHTKNNFA